MQWHELKSEWKNHSPEIDTTGTEDEMLARVRKDAQRFDRRIRNRDRLETVIAIALFVFFAFMFPTVDGWLAKSGVAIIMASCAFTIWRLYRARNRHIAEPLQPVRERLQVEIRKLDEQATLLGNVLWWYLLPPGIGIAMLTVGVAGFTAFTLTYLVFVAVLYGWIYFLNRNAVKNDLMPRRNALLALLEEIDHEQTATEEK